MPEFEENKDAAKTAPYTYEPSQSSAAELGELAGVVLTGGNSGNKTPTKSRWGKSPEDSPQGGVDMTVPAGEIDLSNKDALKDAIIKNPPSTRSPGKARDQDSSRKDTPRQSSNDDRQEHQRRSGNRSERREGGGGSDDRPERREDGKRSDDRRDRRSDRSERREDGKRSDDRRDRRSDRSERREDGKRSGDRRGHGENRNQSGENRDRDRSAHQDSKSKEIKPVVTPIQVEPETFSDKIVNFVKMLFGGSTVETKTPTRNRSSERSSDARQDSGRRNRRRRGGGQGRSGGQHRSGSGDNRNRPQGEASQRSGERGSNNGGRRRRRRRQGGGGQGRSGEQRQSDGSSES